MKISIGNRNKAMKIITSYYQSNPDNNFIKADYLELKGFPKDKSKRTIDFLMTSGYLRHYEELNKEFIVLTDKGKFYFEHQSEERWDFMKRSIYVPIAVAAVTALITAIITTVVVFWVNGLLNKTTAEPQSASVSQSQP